MNRAKRVKLVVDATYVPADRARRAELEECRRRNAQVMELVEYGGTDVPPTFERLMSFVAYLASPGETWAIANADIYFDETIHKLRRSHQLGLSVLALTRREEGKLKVNAWHSQDAWVFDPFDGVTARPLRLPFADFEPGRYACDNRLAFELAREGRHVFNPCEHIHVHHLHADRRPNIKPWVPGPYLFVPPTPLAIALAMRFPQGPREAQR